MLLACSMKEIETDPSDMTFWQASKLSDVDDGWWVGDGFHEYNMSTEELWKIINKLPWPENLDLSVVTSLGWYPDSENEADSRLVVYYEDGNRWVSDRTLSQMDV